jgi:Ala-tRNA(Pro) deacylase
MKLQDYLKERHASFDVVPHSDTFDAQHLAQATHVPGRNVAKGVLLRINHPYRYVLAVVPATHRVDLEKLSKKFDGANVQLATAMDIFDHCPDCEFGAIPPVGSRYGIETVVDQSLTDDEYVVFEGDKHDEAIRMTYAEFKRLEHPMVASFARRC